MKKIIVNFIIFILSILLSISASASLYFTYNTTGFSQFYTFDSVYLFNEFLSQQTIINDIYRDDKVLKEWLVTANSLPIPRIFEDKIDDIESVELSTNYISTTFDINGKLYKVFKYFEGSRDSSYYNKWDDAKYKEKYHCRTYKINNTIVYYKYDDTENHFIPDKNKQYDDIFLPSAYYSTRSYYYFEQNQIHYMITITESVGFSVDDLALCDITELSLSIKPGWHEIEGYKCYRDKNGKAVTKPTVIDGVLYAFTKNGVCKGTYTGWAKSAGNKVYYKDGLKVTKNTTINGVRWKFDKNGICQGKYSGFVRSSKGRRYYNNGVMLRNQKFTLNGKKYVADSKGWVTEI